SKDELMKRVWPNSFVEEANLSVNISALRRALGDRPDGQELIVTVPKMGYRFVIPVREIRDAVPAKSEASEVPGPTPTLETQPAISKPTNPSIGSVGPLQGRRSDNASRWAKAAGLLGVILAILVFVVYRIRETRGVALVGPRKIAILPFQNLNK